MRIRRMDVESEIDYAICHKVSEKNRRVIVPEFYEKAIELIIDTLNSVSDDELPERLYNQFMELGDGAVLWNLIGDLVLQRLVEIRYHFIQEGFDRNFKYKYVKSTNPVIYAYDEIVPDLELSLHGLQVSKENVDYTEVVDAAPELDSLNELYDTQEREIKSNRKYSSRF